MKCRICFNAVLAQQGNRIKLFSHLNTQTNKKLLLKNAINQVALVATVYYLTRLYKMYRHTMQFFQPPLIFLTEDGGQIIMIEFQTLLT